MKTIQEVEVEINDILTQIEANKKAKIAKNAKLSNRLDFLKTMKWYLKTNPNEDFIRKELNRVQRLVDLIDDGFDYWFKSSGMTDKKKARIKYNTELGYDKSKQQIKTLTFLL